MADPSGGVLKVIKRCVKIKSNRWSVETSYDVRQDETAKPKIPSFTMEKKISFDVSKFAFNMKATLFVCTKNQQLKPIPLEFSVSSNTSILKGVTVSTDGNNDIGETILSKSDLIALGDGGLVLKSKDSEGCTIVKSKKYAVTGKVNDVKTVYISGLLETVKRERTEDTSFIFSFDFDVPCKYTQHHTSFFDADLAGGAFRFNRSTHDSWLTDLYGVEEDHPFFMSVPPTLEQHDKLASKTRDNDLPSKMTLVLLKKHNMDGAFRYFYGTNTVAIPSNSFMRGCGFSRFGDNTNVDIMMEMLQKEKEKAEDLANLLSIMFKNMDKGEEQPVRKRLRDEKSYARAAPEQIISYTQVPTETSAPPPPPIEETTPEETNEDHTPHSLDMGAVITDLEEGESSLYRQYPGLYMVEYAKKDGFYNTMVMSHKQKTDLLNGYRTIDFSERDDRPFLVEAALSCKAVKAKVFDQIVVDVKSAERRQRSSYVLKTKAIVYDVLPLKIEQTVPHHDADVRSLFEDKQGALSIPLQRREMETFSQTGATTIVDYAFRNIKSKSDGSDYKQGFEAACPLGGGNDGDVSDETLSNVKYGNVHLYGTKRYGTNTKSFELSTECDESRNMLLSFGEIKYTNEKEHKEQQKSSFEVLQDTIGDFELSKKNAKTRVKTHKTMECSTSLLFGWKNADYRKRNEPERALHDHHVSKRNGDTFHMLKEDNKNSNVVYMVCCGATSVKVAYENKTEPPTEWMFSNMSKTYTEASNSTMLEIIPYVRYLSKHINDVCYEFVQDMQKLDESIVMQKLDESIVADINAAAKLSDDDVSGAKSILSSKLFSNIVIVPLVTSNPHHGETITRDTHYELTRYNLTIEAYEEKELSEMGR